MKWNNRAVKGNNSQSSGEQTLENDIFWQPAAMHAALLTGTNPNSVIPGTSGTYGRCGSTQVGPYPFTYAFREHRFRWGSVVSVVEAITFTAQKGKQPASLRTEARFKLAAWMGCFPGRERPTWPDVTSVCVVCPIAGQCVLLWVCTLGVQSIFVFISNVLENNNCLRKGLHTVSYFHVMMNIWISNNSWEAILSWTKL